MEVPRVGGGPAGVDLAGVLRTLATQRTEALLGAARPGDTFTTLLRELSAPAITKLLEVIDRPLAPESTAHLESLLRASIAAVAEANAPRALERLAEFAALDPRRAEILASEPGLAPIRPEISQLLSHLTATARLDAESWLERATEHVQAARIQNLVERELSPELALALAGRLLEAGGYANYLHSAELSRMAVNLYIEAPVLAVPEMVARKRVQVPPEPSQPRPRIEWKAWLQRLWRRGPLLVLLLGWLGVGLLGGLVSAVWRSNWLESWPQSLANLAFDLWAVGFLGLVGFGFYMRARSWRW
jgi:hypothetical protein